MSHKCRDVIDWQTDGVTVWCPCMLGIAIVRRLEPNEGTFAPCPDPEVQKAHAHFLAAAPRTKRERDALLGALQGEIPEAPEVGPLSWLRSAIAELKKRQPAPDDPDPSAYWEMVNELEAFEKAGTAALKKVRA